MTESYSRRHLFAGPVVPMTLHVLYVTIGPFVPEGSPYSKVIIGFYLIYCLVFFVITNKKYHDSIIISLNCFLVMQFVYFLFFDKTYLTLLSGNIYGGQRLLSIFLSILPFYIFYYYSRKGRLTDRNFVFFTVFLIIMAVPKFFYEQQKLLLSFLINKGIEVEDTTINVGYIFLETALLLPLIKRNKYLSLFIMVICGFFIIYSAKRGAILLYSVLLLLYIPSFLEKAGKKIFIILAVFIISCVIGSNLIKQNDYLQKRYEATLEGNMSNRDILYSKILDYCFGVNYSTSGLFFGYGFVSSKDVAGNVAHNDWLELLVDNGLLGLVIYLNIYAQIWKRNRRILDERHKQTCKYILIIMFLKSLISMSFSDIKYIYVILGYVMGNADRLSIGKCIEKVRKPIVV